MQSKLLSYSSIGILHLTPPKIKYSPTVALLSATSQITADIVHFFRQYKRVMHAYYHLGNHHMKTHSSANLTEAENSNMSTWG